jgi:hypothetical protein
MVISHVLDEKYINNIKNSFKNADFALITSEEYRGSIEFKYKVVNPKHQLAKMCGFLNSLGEKYDWYVKIRPDIEINRCISFDNLSKDAVNARCRVYIGNKKIPYGSSLGGIWEQEHIKSIGYHPTHEHVVLDDQLYIFHRNVLEKGVCLPPLEEGKCSEWCHTNHWIQRGVKLNPVGYDIIFHHPELGLVTSNHI